MEANVILHNLRHEAIDRTAHRRNQMKNVSAADFLLKRTLHGLDLPTDATHTFQELGLLADRVGHELFIPSVIGYPPYLYWQAAMIKGGLSLRFRRSMPDGSWSQPYRPVAAVEFRR